MFDPLLELRRKRMMGMPQMQGNIQTPDVGPDIAPAPVPQMTPMQMPAPAEPSPFAPLAQLGAERGMSLLMQRLRKPDPEAGAGLERVPVLKNLFRRTT